MCCFVCSICTRPANTERTGVTCCPHKGPKDGTSIVLTSGHQWNVGTPRRSGCHTPLGASFIARGTSAATVSLCGTSVQDTAACGQRQYLSTNAPCGHTELLEGSGNTPGKWLPLGGCTELSHMWQALASEATWPLWDYSPLYNLSFKQRAHLAGLFSRLHEDCILVKDWIKGSM